MTTPRSLVPATLKATAAAAALLLGNVPAFAQPASSPPAASETITITGEKITRDQKNSTASVGVIDARRIEESGIRSVADSLRLIGNVRDADWLDAGIVFRGINSEGVGGPVGRPLATTYIDGVAQTLQGARRGALGSWDVSQIEVFRGPQSTSFGRNSLAGAISVRTNDPVGEFESAARVQLGSESFKNVAAMVNVPLMGNALSGRVAVEWAESDGDIDYTYPNAASLPFLGLRSTERFRQFRGKLLFQPAGAQGLRVLFTHQQGYDSPSYDDVDGPLPTAPDRDFFKRTWGSQTSPVFDQARGNHNEHTGVEVAYPLGGGWTLNSSTTYTNTRLDVRSVDGGRLEQQPQREKAQELRANLDLPDLKAVLGVYANNGRSRQDIDEVRAFQPTRLRVQRSRTDIENRAVFGEANYTTGAITWLAGVRVDRESLTSGTTFRITETTNGALLTNTASDFGTDYDATLPKLGLTYALSPASTLGFVFQQGYRAGGAAFNTLTNEAYTFGPEKSNNYELSYRLESADKRTRFSANAFYTDWKNMQISVARVFGGGQGNTVNITESGGTSTVRGFELELQTRPTRDLLAYGSIGYADTKFKDFSAVVGGQLTNFGGLPFPQAPKLTAALGGSWRIGAAQVGGDLKHTGRAISRSLFEGLPADYMPAYTVLNLNASMGFGAFRLSAFVTNVTDEKYVLYRYSDPAFPLATTSEPRKFSIQLDAKF
jgi:outer membrane receptor protein involved in Fe transport